MRSHIFILVILSSVAGAAASACARQDASALSGGGQSSAASARAGDIQLPHDPRIVAARVVAGATLASVLRGCKVAEAEVAAVVARAASVFDVRKVRTAQPYRLEQADDGLLRRFEYEIDSDRLLRVTRSPSEAGFVAEVLPIAKTRALVT